MNKFYKFYKVIVASFIIITLVGWTWASVAFSTSTLPSSSVMYSGFIGFLIGCLGSLSLIAFIQISHPRWWTFLLLLAHMVFVIVGFPIGCMLCAKAGADSPSSWGIFLITISVLGYFGNPIALMNYENGKGFNFAPIILD